MKIKQLLTKTLLVAVGLLAGQSVVAEPDTWLTTLTGQVGLIANTGSFKYGNKKVKVAAGETYVYTLINYNNGDNAQQWKNWVVEANSGSKFFDCEARGNKWQAGGANEPNYAPVISTSDVENWQSAYNGATVTITVSRSSDGTQFTITHTSNVLGTTDGNTDKYYGGTFTVAVGANEEWDVYLTEEESHMNITKVAYTNASSVTTSYVLRDCASSITAVGTTTYGTDGSGNSSTIRLNSYAAQGGAGAFAFTLDEDWDASKVISATLSFYPISKCDKDGRSGDIKIHSLDAYPAVSTTSTSYSEGKHIVYSYGTSNTKRYTFSTTTLATVAANGANTAVPAKGAYYGVDLTSHIQSLTTKSAGDYVYLGIDISDWAADITIGAYGNDYAPKMEIAYTTATLYTATFTETNSLSPEVTIYSDAGMTSPVTNGTLENGTTYYYKAVLYGYNDVTGNFTVSSTDPSINFAMTAKETYNYSLKYKLGTADAVEQASGTKYVDETVTLYYPICRQDASSNYYVVSKNNSAPYFGVVISSSNSDVTINYTLDEDIVYYSESENMDGTRYSVGQVPSLASNGTAYCSAASSDSYQVTNWEGLAAGNYDIEVGMGSRGYSVSPAPQLKSGAEAEATATLKEISLGASSHTVKEYKNQPIAAGDQLYFYNDNSPNASKWALDYVILRRIPASVSATITPTGYATFSSPYALDFSNAITNLEKVYYASAVAKGSVTMTELTQKVPAETGLFLKGTPNATVTIPVVASGAAINGTNYLKPNTASTSIAASTAGTYHYVFAYTTSDNSNPGFYNLASALTLGAGKAYLETNTDIKPTTQAKVSFLFTDGEVTGISNVNADNSLNVNANAGKMYNAAGQLVNEGYKGIVIMNGKKVVK